MQDGDMNGGVVTKATDATPKVTEDLGTLTAAIVSAYVHHNALSTGDVIGMIRDVHAALMALRTGAPAVIEQKREPAVSIRKSITPDYLVCLDDGLKFRSMKRHLKGLGMTPDEYRKKWDLPFDYPMVAPNYSAVRSKLAKDTGLGRKAGSTPAPKRTTRTKVA
jgi:predicted transcriptional regulator